MGFSMRFLSEKIGIEGGFLGKIRSFHEEMREKGGLMSGAAARTGTVK